MVNFKQTLIVLDVVAGFTGFGRVSLHDVVVHERSSSEKTETSRAAQYTAEHMLCSLLEPVAYRIFKLLIPHHGPFKHSEEII